MRYQAGDIVLKDWKIVRWIGGGASGAVYEVQKDGLGVPLKAALKVMRVPQDPAITDALHGDGMDEFNVTHYLQGIVEDLTKEIELMAGLKGFTQIVSCEDYQVIKNPDLAQWDVLIRMELLTPLQVYQRDHDLSEEDIYHMAVQLVKALVFLEEKNIVHRDIKPQNLFVNESGTYKLGDFGIARICDQAFGNLSRKGTDNYMAPELYLAKPYDKTVDIYSLGLVLYKAVNKNRLPFYPQEGAYTKEVCQEALEKRISGQALELPAKASLDFGQIILKMCAYRAEDRYQNAEELLRALEGIRPSRRIVLRRQQIKLGTEKEQDVIPHWEQAMKAENQEDTDCVFALPGMRKKPVAASPKTQMATDEANYVQDPPKQQENVSNWQANPMQDSEIPWRSRMPMEEGGSGERNRSRSVHRKRKGFLLGAAAGVVFLGVAVPIGISFLKNQAEDSALTSGMAEALTQEKTAVDTSTTNSDSATPAADGMLEEHLDTPGAGESLETPPTDWTAVDELDATMSDGAVDNVADADVQEVPDKTEFQIIDDSDLQSGANQDTAQAGMDGTKTANVPDSDALEGSPYVVVKCEDDERYTFLYEEQSTDSKKKLKLRKHNEVIVSEVSTQSDVTWGYVTYCGCSGWVQMQFLWGVNDVDRGDWQPGTYFVSVDKMNLRESPSESAESVGKLSYGEEVVIQSFQNGWGEIHYGDRNGFVYMPCLMSYQLGTYIVNTDADYGIHFRSTPDKQNTEILCDIPNGSALSISGFSKGWGYTQYNGMDGWVHLSDLYIEYVI